MHYNPSHPVTLDLLELLKDSQERNMNHVRKSCRLRSTKPIRVFRYMVWVPASGPPEFIPLPIPLRSRPVYALATSPDERRRLPLIATPDNGIWVRVEARVKIRIRVMARVRTGLGGMLGHSFVSWIRTLYGDYMGTLKSTRYRR